MSYVDPIGTGLLYLKILNLPSKSIFFTIIGYVDPIREEKLFFKIVHTLENRNFYEKPHHHVAQDWWLKFKLIYKCKILLN